MIQELLKGQILQHVGTLKPSRKGWLTRNCFMCKSRGHSQDKRSRFGLHFDPDGSIGAHCFNCMFEASWSPGKTLSDKFKTMLSGMGISDEDIQRLQFEAFRHKQNIDISDTIVKFKGTITSNWVETNLPNNSLSIKQWLELGCEDINLVEVATYAISRGINNLDDFYWSPDYKFSRKLIIPFTFGNKIVGYCLRKVSDNIRGPKYLNTMSTHFIYNLDKQVDSREILIICEGVLDAYLTGGISPINNSFTEDQITYLKGLGKKIILCPDRDVAGDELVKIAMREGWAVTFPKWSSDIKDPAQAISKYGRLAVINSIVESTEYNALSVQLKWRINKNERHKKLR